MNKPSWKPETVEQCMIAFHELLSPEEERELICCTKDALITYHHGLGRFIRNNWDLWAGGPLVDHLKSLGFIHPDDMSQSLIEEYWNRKNGRSSTMEQDIKEYAAYWEKNK